MWSLGITLIELAEGRPPNNDICTIYDLMKLPNRPPPKLKHASKHSPEFNDLIASCLVKEVDQRVNAVDLLKVTMKMHFAINASLSTHLY